MDIAVMRRSFHQASALFRQLTRQVFCSHGITRGQPQVLGYLHMHDGCIQRELADALHLEPASVSALLSGLEKSGLVRREPDENDRRVWRVTLTETGRACGERIHEGLDRIDEAMFAGLTDEQKEVFSVCCERVRRNLESFAAQSGVVPEAPPGPPPEA